MSKKIIMATTGVGIIAAGSLLVIKRLVDITDNIGDSFLADNYSEDTEFDEYSTGLGDFEEENPCLEVTSQESASLTRELTFPTIPKSVTDDKMDECRASLKAIISGEKKWKDFSSKDRCIIECILYEKLCSLPEDLHVNHDVWFIATHLSAFARRMKIERPIVYERLNHLADNYRLPNWAAFRIHQIEF